MSGSDVVVARSSLVEEMAGGPLGDQRLEERRDRLMALLEQHPDAPFPEACADDAEVEALYRFLRNRRVSLGALIAPHVAASQRRCAAADEVLVIHDTTDMVFAGETARAGLAALGKGRHGFWYTPRWRCLRTGCGPRSGCCRSYRSSARPRRRGPAKMSGRASRIPTRRVDTGATGSRRCARASGIPPPRSM